MSNFFIKTKFWQALRNSLAVVTGPVTVGIHEMGGADIWVMISGFSGMLGAILSIWMVDHDNNGVVDLFE